MEYPPPVVIEHVIPSNFDAGWVVAGLHFRREKESVGADYDCALGMLIGARFSDTTHTITGPVHDSIWTLKITVPF